jgi:hypothetical protein
VITSRDGCASAVLYEPGDDEILLVTERDRIGGCVVSRIDRHGVELAFGERRAQLELFATGRSGR